jgi:DNA polymerase-3 subunit gamma/tau
VTELDAASHTGIGDMRELQEGMMFGPSASRFKVYILDEAHMLSGAAWNSMLKTVEEPPPHAKFVFATTEARKVPVTVLSRCQRFDLRRVEPEALAGAPGRDLPPGAGGGEPDALALIARAAEGSVRDSLSLLDQAIALSEGPGSCRDRAGDAGPGRPAARARPVRRGDARCGARGARPVRRALRAGRRPAALVQDLLDVCHSLSRLKVRPEAGGALGLGGELLKRARAMAEDLSLPVLARAWQMLLRGTEEVRAAPDGAAAAEMLLLRLACVAELPPPAELARLLQGGAAPTAPAARSAAPAAPPPARERAPVAVAAPPTLTAEAVSLAPAPALTPATLPPAEPAAPDQPRSFAELVARIAQAGRSCWRRCSTRARS